MFERHAVHRQETPHKKPGEKTGLTTTRSRIRKRGNAR